MESVRHESCYLLRKLHGVTASRQTWRQNDDYSLLLYDAVSVGTTSRTERRHAPARLGSPAAPLRAHPISHVKTNSGANPFKLTTHLSLRSVEVRNEWRYASTRTYSSIAS